MLDEPLGPEFRMGLIAATILLGRRLHEMKADHNVDQMAWAHRLVHPILEELLDPPVEDWEALEDDLVARGLIPPAGPDPFVGHVDERGRISVAPADAEAGRTLADGSPVTPDHREIDPATGQQRAYVVLSAEERAKGFVRPVRRSYRHQRCGTVTTMSLAIAETYARDPGFYGGTFCCGCGTHFPVGPDGEFTWDGTDEKVGT